MNNHIEIKEWYDKSVKPYIRIKQNTSFPHGVVITDPANFDLFQDTKVFGRCEIDYDDTNLIGVLYQPNLITFSSLGNSNKTVISFQFTGCYMAKFQATDSSFYACHIYSTGGTVSTDGVQAWRELYRTRPFMNGDTSNCTQFKPIKADNSDYIYKKFNSNRRNFITCGIIDKYNKCYALLLKRADLSVVSEGCCCSKQYFAREMTPISGSI